MPHPLPLSELLFIQLQTGGLHGEDAPAQGAGTSQSSDPSAPPPQGCQDGAGMNLGLLVMMFAIFYFLMIRPQQKRQREHDSMLKALEKGAIVRTTGGIRGEIISIDDKEVRLEIADRVKINVLRSNIAGRIQSDADKAKESEKTKAAKNG